MVLIVDDLLIGSFRFVLGKLAEAVNAELNDDKVYREELLAAQMRLELGEITDEEFAEIETDLFARIREVKERQGVAAPAAGTYKVEGADVSADFGHDEEEPSPPSRRK
jgi:Gas vesicle protein G